MSNENLIKYQEEGSNEVITKYFFECTSSKVKGVTKSPVCKALKKVIRLHLFRYGFVNKKSSTDTVLRFKTKEKKEQDRLEKERILKEKTAQAKREGKKPPTINDISLPISIREVEVNHPDILKLENFYLARRFLNKGYIYIIDEADNGKYKEYYVTETGMLQPIIWRKGNDKDNRKPEGDSVASIILNKAGEYYIAYSPVQWTRAYFDEIKADQKKKDAYMQRINCVGIEIGSSPESDERVSYKDVNVITDGERHKYRQDFKKNLHVIDVDERKQSEKGGNQTYEDLFITLHDQIGCVDDISRVLDESFLDLKAILVALETGRDKEIILNNYKQGKEDTVLTPKEEQIKYLFHTALKTYQLVYNNAEMIDDYDGGREGSFGGIYKPKLVKILGVEERKKQRKKIRSIRNDLGSFMNTEYYKQSWVSYNQDNDDCKLNGKYRLTKQICLLSKKPHDIDRHLDLKYHYEDKNDDFESFFEYTVDDDPNKPINKLLDSEIEIIFLTGPLIDIENKLAGVTTKLVESYATRMVEKTEMVTKTKTVTTVKVREKVSFKKVEVQTYKDVTIRRLRKRKIYGVTVLDLQPKEYEGLFKGNIKPDNSRLVTSRANGKPLYKPHDAEKPLQKRFKVTDELVLKKQLRGKNLVQFPVVETDIEAIKSVEQYLDTIKEEFIVPETKEVNKFTHAELAQKLFDGKIFTGALAVLQVFNALNALNTVYNDVNLKNIANVTGVFAELTEASLAYHRAQLLAKGMSSELYAGTRLFKVMNISEGIGNAATVVICLWEAFDSYNVRDYDASIAWTSAGLLWGVFFYAPGMGFTIAGVAVAFFALIATACAYYLCDTPLETFFKYNLLSDVKSIGEVDPNEKPWNYTNRLYADRQDVADKETSIRILGTKVTRDYTNPKIVYQDLLDLIVCGNIRFSIPPGGKKLVKSMSPFMATQSVDIDIYDIYSYTARLEFSQFLTSADQIEYELYYFKNGLSTKSSKRICPITEDKRVKKYDNFKRRPEAIIDFTLSKGDLMDNNEKSRLLFVCRLRLPDDSFYPLSLNSEERYVISNFPTQQRYTQVSKGVFSTTEIKNTDFQSKTKIDVLKNFI